MDLGVVDTGGSAPVLFRDPGRFLTSLLAQAGTITVGSRKYILHGQNRLFTSVGGEGRYEDPLSIDLYRLSPRSCTIQIRSRKRAHNQGSWRPLL